MDSEGERSTGLFLIKTRMAELHCTGQVYGYIDSHLSFPMEVV